MDPPLNEKMSQKLSKLEENNGKETEFAYLREIAELVGK